MASVLAHKQLGAPEEPELQKASAEWSLHEPAQLVDAKDADTPDSWIPRHTEILRLTGRHPLNCEPPMERLMGAGFITPTSLHLVSGRDLRVVVFLLACRDGRLIHELFCE